MIRSRWFLHEHWHYWERKCARWFMFTFVIMFYDIRLGFSEAFMQHRDATRKTIISSTQTIRKTLFMMRVVIGCRILMSAQRNTATVTKKKSRHIALTSPGNHHNVNDLPINQSDRRQLINSCSLSVCKSLFLMPYQSYENAQESYKNISHFSRSTKVFLN